MSPHETLVCDTTPLRIFTIVGQLDVLVEVLDGTVRVPRQVLDPDDDFATPDLLSEIGRTERYFATRSRDPEAGDIRARFAELRTRAGLEVIDLTAREVEIYQELRSANHTRSAHDLAGELGCGESAAIAIAEGRGWGVVMDDDAARQALVQHSPETVAYYTSRELLRQAVTRDILDSGCARLVYDDMLTKGYRGPERLF